MKGIYTTGAQLYIAHELVRKRQNIFMYIHIYIWLVRKRKTYTYTYIYLYTCVYQHKHVRTHIYTHTYLDINTKKHAHIYIGGPLNYTLLTNSYGSAIPGTMWMPAIDMYSYQKIRTHICRRGTQLYIAHELVRQRDSGHNVDAGDWYVLFHVFPGMNMMYRHRCI